LGKFKSKGGSGAMKQISADAISQAFVDNTASGSDKKGVVVLANEMGALGVKNKAGSGSGNGPDTGSALVEAQTTLRGAKDFSPQNSGPLAHADGLKGAHTIGSGAGTNATTHTSGGSGNGNSLSDGTDVSGGLTKAEVFAVISAHRREIRTCFESALLVRNDLNGILRIAFTISAPGSVTEIKLVNSEVKSDILESCVVQIIRQMAFPEAKNKLPTKVIYPFVFKRSS
jgi:hypothetical protein